MRVGWDVSSVAPVPSGCTSQMRPLPSSPLITATRPLPGSGQRQPAPPSPRRRRASPPEVPCPCASEPYLSAARAADSWAACSSRSSSGSRSGAVPSAALERPARSARRRATRSWAAAGRAGTCRSGGRGALPRRRPCRCSRSPDTTRPRGCSPVPRYVRPPWFSKPARRRGPSPRSASITTLPIRRSPGSRTVRRSTSPRPGSDSSPTLVGVAEQLIAAAHGQHRRARVERGSQRVALALHQIARHQCLIAVLSTAHVEEVVCVRVDRLTGARGAELEPDAAPLAAPLEQR